MAWLGEKRGESKGASTTTSSSPLNTQLALVTVSFASSIMRMGQEPFTHMKRTESLRLPPRYHFPQYSPSEERKVKSYFLAFRLTLSHPRARPLFKKFELQKIASLTPKEAIQIFSDRMVMF